MKYTVVTHEAGYTETLEFRGKTYKKNMREIFLEHQRRIKIFGNR